MNKQELYRILCQYLPYKVKIQGQTHGEIAELSALNENNVNIKGRGFTYGWWSDIFDIKLLLHPLSDLANEIEHGGRKFVPIIELAKLFYINPNAYKITHYENPKRTDRWFQVNCCVENDSSRYTHFNLNAVYISNNQYKFIQKLHEWHFDTDDLIGQKLAIDINSINQ